MRFLCIIQLLIAAVLIPIYANAQVLWGQARLGMSPAQVLHLYPDAKATSNKIEDRSDERKELLHMPFLAMGEMPSTVHFFFQSERLRAVVWRLSPVGDFDATVPRYEEFLYGLKREHPVSSKKKSARQLNSHRYLSDEWTTSDGVDMNILLMDEYPPIPIRFTAIAEGSILAWFDIQLNEKRVQDQKEQARQIERINKKKKMQAQDYNKFLDAFIGIDISELAGQWGAPTGVTHLPNSDIIYVWGFKSDEWQCRTSIFTSANGRITKWQWSGNSCNAKKN